MIRMYVVHFRYTLAIYSEFVLLKYDHCSSVAGQRMGVYKPRMRYS